MSKTALIVDDSKSARVVLKRMLETYDLTVDTTESAEEALDYLVSHRPDVIFMDHLMPGMDGFEAVSAIKKNPDTAMIPIMMYTSQEGEVYVGQARALGAVGVLPKTVKPVEVSKVLASLHLAEEPPESAVQQPAAETTTEQPGDESLPDKNLRLLLQDLFDQQRVILQRELRDTYSDLAARFISEMPPHQDEPATLAAAGLEEEQGTSRWLAVLLIAVLVFVLVLFLQQRELADLRQQNAQLADHLVSQPIENNQQQSIAGFQRALDNNRVAMIDALEWGVNQSSAYAWDQIPLGEYRLQIFEQLFSRLVAIGYTGTIAVEVHAGDFCMVDDGRGLLVLAPEESPAADCDQIGFDPVESLSVGYRQSVGFANFVVMAEERSGGVIGFIISSAGDRQPRLAYPDTTVGVSAGEWNSIAAQNQRVVVTLSPE